jgi:hypothetical protein
MHHHSFLISLLVHGKLQTPQAPNTPPTSHCKSIPQELAADSINPRLAFRVKLSSQIQPSQKFLFVCCAAIVLNFVKSYTAADQLYAWLAPEFSTNFLHNQKGVFVLH